MLNEIAETHARRVSVLRAERDHLRSEAVSSCERLSDRILYEANSGAEQVYLRQLEIERQSRTLEKASSGLVKESERWVGMYRKFNEALKEVGEVESWAKAIQSDLEEVMLILKD
jgi:biogenesis of lysosome-related organelles complex 1 subunit 1